MGKDAEIRWLDEPEEHDYPAARRVIVADGYHRMCSVYSFDEDAMISCKIV